MAHIGMRRLYYAAVKNDITDEERRLAQLEGTLLYSADTFGVIEGARRADVTYNRADGTLYGDDKLAEKWDLTLSADIEIEWAPRVDDAHVVSGGPNSEGGDMAALGVEESKYTEDGPLYSLRNENEIWVGFGYVQVQIVNDVARYRAVKFHKVLFHLATEETQTKEEQIQWGCPILRGHAVPVELKTDTGVVRPAVEMIRDFQDFDTLTAADAWLRAAFPEEAEVGVETAD